MKRLLLFLTCTLLLFGVSKAAVSTWTFGGSSKPDDIKTDISNLEKAGFTFTHNSSHNSNLVGGNYIADNTKGLQFGTGNNPATSLTFTSTDDAPFAEKKITAVKINTSGAKDTNAKVNVSVGNTSFTPSNQAITNTSTDYAFTGAATGQLTISFTQTSKTAIYLYSLEVTYENSVTPPTTITFDPISGQELSLTDVVSLTADVDNYTISYSIDDKDGTYETYTSPFSLPSVGPHKVYAKAWNSANESNPVRAEASYTVVKEEAKEWPNAFKNTYTVEIGKNVALFEDGVQHPSMSYTFNSDNNGEVSIENDRVTGKKIGNVNVTASWNEDDTWLSGTAQFTVEVTKVNATLSFPQEVYTIAVNKTFNAPTVTVEEGYNDVEIIYSSSVPTVATVDEKTGGIQLIGEGQTIITATIANTDKYNGNSASYSLIVTEAVNESTYTFDFLNNDYEMTRYSTGNDYNTDNQKLAEENDIIITNIKGSGNGTRLWTGEGIRFYNTGKIKISSDILTITNIEISSKNNDNFEITNENGIWYVRYTPTSSNTSLNTLTVTYINNETPILGEIIGLTPSEETIINGETYTINLGESLTFKAKNATSWTLLADNDDSFEEDKSATGDEFVWRPETFGNNIEVIVEASDGTSETKELLFYLNVVKPSLGELTVSYNDIKVEAKGSYTVPVGTKFTFSCENATVIYVEAMDEETEEVYTFADVNGNTAEWTVDKVYSELEINVSAWLDKESERNNVQTLEFYLTSTEPEDDSKHTPRAGDKYTLVKDVKDLEANCHYVIAYSEGNTAMSNSTINNGVVGGSAVTIENGILSASENTLVLNLTKNSDGNYLWNFVNYSGQGTSSGLGNASSGNNLTATALPSTVELNNGDITISFTGSPSNKITYRTGTVNGFKNYAKSNSTSEYKAVQLYKFSESAVVEYTDFSHNFENKTIPLGESRLIFESGEKYPSSIKFTVEDGKKNVASVTPTSNNSNFAINGLEAGEAIVTVTWDKDDVNYFNASPEGGVTFTVFVEKENKGMFDFTKKDAYGMTSTNDGNTYEKETIITGVEDIVEMEITGKFRSWSSTSSYDLRMYATEGGSTIKFSVPSCYTIKSVVFDFNSNGDKMTAQEGEIKNNEWILPEDYIVANSISFSPEGGNPYIKNITVYYEKTKIVNLNATSGDFGWDYEWSNSKNKLPIAFEKIGSSDFENGVENDDISFIFEPAFTPDESTESAANVDAGYTPISKSSLVNGEIEVALPCSGLYQISIKSNNTSKYAFNGKESAIVDVANIYPSLDGLELSYVSAGTLGDNAIPAGETRKFSMTDNVIKYTFEIQTESEDPDNNPAGDNWYHENPKKPFVNINAQGVDIWYKLHGVEDVVVPEAPKTEVEPETPETDTENSSFATMMNAKRKIAGADPGENGFAQAVGKNNQINIERLAYAGDDEKQLSFIMVKNGASTPMSVTNSEQSEQVVRIIKNDNDPTSVEEIAAEEAETEYYTLQGIRVQNPEKGIYIVKKGSKTSKVIL